MKLFCFSPGGISVCSRPSQYNVGFAPGARFCKVSSGEQQPHSKLQPVISVPFHQQPTGSNAMYRMWLHQTASHSTVTRSIRRFVKGVAWPGHNRGPINIHQQSEGVSRLGMFVGCMLHPNIIQYSRCVDRWTIRVDNPTQPLTELL